MASGRRFRRTAWSFTWAGADNTTMNIFITQGAAAGLAWVCFGLILLAVNRGRHGIGHWADACLSAMVIGIAIHMVGVLVNALLSTGGDRISGRHPVSFKPTTESLLETVHPADRRRVAQTIDRARTDKEPFSIQYRTVLPDGSVRTLQFVGQVSFALEGRPLPMTGTAQDVTDRVELEREILIVGEQERERIGRDLHDGLSQELTGISLRLRRSFWRIQGPWNRIWES